MENEKNILTINECKNIIKELEKVEDSYNELLEVYSKINNLKNELELFKKQLIEKIKNY